MTIFVIFYETLIKLLIPEVDVLDIFGLVGCERLSRKSLKYHESHPTAWELSPVKNLIHSLIMLSVPGLVWRRGLGNRSKKAR